MPAVAARSAPTAAAAPERRVAASSAAQRRQLVQRTPLRPPGALARGASPMLPAAGVLKVSSPQDAAEHEADRVARRVVSLPAPATAMISSAAKVIHRKNLGDAPAVTHEVTRDLHASRNAGSALTPGLRRYMEPRFGADFESVRLHTDERAARMAQRLSARAFTAGSHIFFGQGQFRPDSDAGRELIAHELTHTIQQGAAIQRKADDTAVQQTASPQVQRGAWDSLKNKVASALPNPLDYVAEHANLIPGFRMFTLVLGVNPVNMSPVDRSAANLFRALVEFMPGGGFITMALDAYGVFDKIADFVKQQIESLGMVGSAIKQAVGDFIDSLSGDDLLHPGNAWDRAKRIFTEPIDRIKAFVAGLVDGIVELIKAAILRPLGKLAEGTAGYALLKGVLGRDPITGDRDGSSGEDLLGAIMTMAGQEETWAKVKQAKAIPRVVAWFNGAKDALVNFVSQIPDLVVAGIKALQLADIVAPVTAFAKVAKVFGSFVSQFTSWAISSGLELLKIVFDVVSPGAWSYVQKTGAALKNIVKNPLPFMGNLVNAAKLGFSNFAGNFLGHLKRGLLDWLTGSLPGVYIPQALSLPEFGKLALSVFGISWAQIRGKIVKALGNNGEAIMQGLETAFDVVKALVTGGPAAAWNVIKDKLSDLKDSIVSGIISFITETVVTKAIPKLVAMFIPGAGFISAIITIYQTIQTFIQKISKIIQVVMAFVDSVVAIAAGNIAAAAARVESILGGLLSLAISFLAGFVGLNKVSDKIMTVINKVRDKVDKALDAAVNFIVGKAKALFAKLFNKKGKDDSDEDKQKRLSEASDAALSAVSRFADKPVGDLVLKPLLAVIRVRYRLKSLEPVKSGDFWSIRAEINPVKVTKTTVRAGKTSAEIEIGYEPQWPLDEFNSKANAIKRAAEGKTQNQAMTLGFEAGSKTKRVSTDDLRQGEQDRFRGRIHAYINQISVQSDQDAARGLMSGLQADHQQELQMGGTDTPENMAMIESRMNSQMGAMFKGQLKDLPPETKISKVKIQTATGTAKAAKPRKSGKAAQLQALLLKYAKPLKTSAQTIRDWFKLD